MAKEKKAKGTTVYSIELTDKQVEILHGHMVSIDYWLQNIINSNVNKLTNEVIEQHTDRQSKKLTKKQKEEILETITIPRATTMEDIVAASAKRMAGEL